jgi:putative membrane protein
MKYMKISKSILLLAIASVSVSAMAADGPAPTPEAFVGKAAQDGMTEVALGKVALNKSQNPEVQKFAQLMVTDHGKANSELAMLAQGKGMDVPKELDPPHAAMVESMESKDGAAFDAAYAEHMSMDHSKAIELFEGAAKSPDADVAGFAKKTLPTLKEHKAMAKKLAAMQPR